MDPLTAFVASIVGALVVEALRSRGELTDFYQQQGEDFRPAMGWVQMKGRKVTWWVEPGEAVWIDAKYLRPLSGNIFYADKLGVVARAVKAAEDTVNFYAAFGQIRLITPELVKESIQYAEYDAGEPFTTGDRKLDRWLVESEEPGNDWADFEDEMERKLAIAVERRSGDLGKWMASVRDGNHRAFGSVLGGEERIPVRIYDNDIVDIRQELGKKNRSPERMALLRKMIVDTGRAPEWMEPEVAELIVGRPLPALPKPVAYDADGLVGVFDYYGTPGVRELQHAFKAGDAAAVERMAREMAPCVVDDAVLVPMPGRTGRARNTLELVRELSRLTGRPFADVLVGKNRPAAYEQKKSGVVPEISFSMSGRLPPGRPVVVDNIIATGTTARAAMAAIPGATVLAHAFVPTAYQKFHIDVGLYDLISKSLISWWQIEDRNGDGIEEAEIETFLGRKGLVYLGGGSERIVLDLGEMVLKVSVPGYSSSNLDEAQVWEEAPANIRKHLVPVLAVDPNGTWLLMEKAPKPPGLLPPEAHSKLYEHGIRDIRGPNVSGDSRLLDYATTAPGLLSQWRKFGGKIVGYRIMRFDPGSGRAVSGADSRQSVELVRGAIHRLHGKGMFLSPTKQYVLDHYLGHDENVLMTYAFHTSDITSGDLEDREPEISVTSATLLDWQIFDADGNPVEEER